MARLANSQATRYFDGVSRKMAGCIQYLVSVVVPAMIWGGGAGVMLVRRRLNLMVTVFHCNGRNRALYDLQPERGHAHTHTRGEFVAGSGGQLKKPQGVTGKDGRRRNREEPQWAKEEGRGGRGGTWSKMCHRGAKWIGAGHKDGGWRGGKKLIEVKINDTQNETSHWAQEKRVHLSCWATWQMSDEQYTLQGQMIWRFLRPHVTLF